MNSQQHSQTFTVSQIDNEFIYDINHILMNYLKMHSLSSNCFSETNIQISPNVLNTAIPPEILKNYNQFSIKYFELLSKKDNAIDLLVPLISNYPNSELGLFLAILLNKHVIEMALILDNSKEKFENYKINLINIYHSILKTNINQKLLENICSSITVLIIIGINGNWTNGINQLIIAAKENNGGDIANVLMASLIISNINYIFEKLKLKLTIKKTETISTYIKGFSNDIKEFTNFLITGAFNGPKENFVNTPLFKAFIGIVQSFKYFDINIIKIHGFLDFLINCISYINVNKDLILQICDIFDYTFSDKNNIGLIFDCKCEYKMEYLVVFLNNISNHKDFKEIKKCIELIMNVKNYYSNKDINEIKNNPKDIQILFASCNIFSSLIENYSYIFFMPEIDEIIQDIYFYFISLPIYNISELLFDSLTNVMYLIHHGYKFDNFSSDINIQNDKLQKFNIFLYKIHNSVFQNMKLESMEEYNNIHFDSFPNNNNARIDKYISEILKASIYNDEKINYIVGATQFYENLYEIINDLYGIKDFCDKLCQFLMNAVNSNDLIIIDCILMIFNTIGMRLNSDLPEVIFNLIDYLLNGNNNLLNDLRFSLEFIQLMLVMRIPISQNIKYINIIIQNLLKEKYNDNEMNFIKIDFIFKLITTSYQTYKNRNKKILKNEEDKNSLMNIFNILSQHLIDNLFQSSYKYLMKLIDSIFVSCFFNIYIGNLSNNVLFNISEKLFNDANKIFNMSSVQNNNKNELYMKYIYIVFSIIKNIGKENTCLLLELYNKIDPSPNIINGSLNNNNISYFTNIENNIIIIINDCSENSQNSDNNIINSIISLCNSMIKPLKEETSNYYNTFSNIISMIHKLNPSNVKEFDLINILYKNIFTYCKSSPIYNQINELCFDILNIMNPKFKLVKKDEDRLLLSIKMCEFILLFFPNVAHNINEICDKHSNNNSIFSYGFNELINNYENNDNEEYNYIFTLLIKTLCENNFIFNDFIKSYVIRLMCAIITHLNNFKSGINKCIPNYFMIFKYFLSGANDEFKTSLKQLFNNDEQISYAIVKYLNFIKYNNYNNLEIKIKDLNKCFIKEIGQLFYAIDTKKNEFVCKYIKFVDDEEKNNERYGFKSVCEKTSSHITFSHK